MHATKLKNTTKEEDSNRTKLQCALLLGKQLPTTTKQHHNHLVSSILDGDFKSCLTSEIAKQLLFKREDEHEQSLLPTELLPFISHRVSNYLKEQTEQARTTQHPALTAQDRIADLQLQLQCIGIAALLAFIQVAWTGPKLNFEDEDFLHPTFCPNEENLASFFDADGEEAYSLTPRPLLLVVAKAFLCNRGNHTDMVDAASKYLENETKDTETDERSTKRVKLDARFGESEEVRYPDLFAASWWTARCLFVQQRIIENKAASLHDLTLALFARSREHLPEISTDDKSDIASTRELRARFELEVGLVHHWYREDRSAKQQLERAQKESGLEWNVGGALGKRTKFQTKDVSQLVIVAKSLRLNDDGEVDGGASTEESDATTTAKVPDAMALNDDTLLEKIAFADGTESSNLRVIDQTLLLAFCLNVKNTNPADGLTTEQMFPFVSKVLEDANNWLVHTMALLLRSRLESTKTRTVERGCLQMQALVDQIVLEESTPQERINHFFALQIPPRWDLERELGERFMNVGAVKSALEIFERLHMWEDVISCHQMLDEQDKAETLTLRQLELHPTSPKLICMLADIRRDPDLYEKAWKVSGNRFARAMRSLGSYWFHHHRYEKSVDAFERALAINPLFENSWYVMGCAAMKGAMWDKAAHAFNRVVALDHENGEAWNNLASVHLRQHRKSDAFHALRMALRQKYDSWRIWQNYLLVATDVFDFPEAVRAISRIVDLRWDIDGEKCVDVECLGLLVDAVVRDIVDVHDRPARVKTAPMLEELIDNEIAPRVATSPDLWRVVAKFYLWNERPQDALRVSEKSYRFVVNSRDPARDYESFKVVAEAASELVDAYRNLGPRDVPAKTKTGLVVEGEGGGVVEKEWRYKARMVLRSLIGRTKEVFEEKEEFERLVIAQEELKELKELKD